MADKWVTIVHPDSGGEAVVLETTLPEWTLRGWLVADDGKVVAIGKNGKVVATFTNSTDPPTFLDPWGTEDSDEENGPGDAYPYK